ncbi:MAG: 16S rRNA (guanine966-N2)-methyltransferase [Myxococcota bacterium]|jgi:16S rRNA (guanine966-N2)-methyltransferase
MPEVRIVGGALRGRRIAVPDKGVRPTSARLREALMSILGPQVNGAHVLDCFAGSGAVGFELLSRGAQSVVFIDKSGSTAKHLKAVAERLSVDDSVQVVRGPATAHLKRLAAVDRQFDILFFDPPYDLGLLQPALQLAPTLMAPGAWVIAEHSATETVDDVAGLAVAEVRCYGGSAVTLMRERPSGGV